RSWRTLHLHLIEYPRRADVTTTVLPARSGPRSVRSRPSRTFSPLFFREPLRVSRNDDVESRAQGRILALSTAPYTLPPSACQQNRTAIEGTSNARSPPAIGLEKLDLHPRSC